MSTPIKHFPSSYRDPSGYIFQKEGILYRQVNKIFKEDFEFFIDSGCYQSFINKNWLVPHELISENISGNPDWYITLKPEKISIISYPYEWSFDMLKDAALLTLNLLKESLGFGLILKDASPYNIQFQNCNPVFIDTLSFEKYNEQLPWIAYRQFCECFLSPLLLSSYCKQPLQQLLLAYPEGIPLTVTRSLLPWRSKFSLHTYLHIHLHAGIAGRNKTSVEKKTIFSKKKLLNLIDSLEGLITKLRLPHKKSLWSEYYNEVNQRENYLIEKKTILNKWLTLLNDINTAADLGANDGEFSCILSEKNIDTIAVDFDPYCINNLYNFQKRELSSKIHPLIIDLANPSPAIGVNNEERETFISRCHSDLVISLAVIHHLAIGKNIPFSMIASMFSQISNKYLIIEFIPKKDEKINEMLLNKKDIYTSYTKENFEKVFKDYFNVTDSQIIGSSGRILYLMIKNEK